MSNTTVHVEDWIREYQAGNQAARNELLRYAERRLKTLIRRMKGKLHARARTSEILTDVMVRMDKALQRVSLPSARDYFNLAAMHIRCVILDMWKRPRPPVELSDSEN